MAKGIARTDIDRVRDEALKVVTPSAYKAWDAMPRDWPVDRHRLHSGWIELVMRRAGVSEQRAKNAVTKAIMQRRREAR